MKQVAESGNKKSGDGEWSWHLGNEWRGNPQLRRAVNSTTYAPVRLSFILFNAYVGQLPFVPDIVTPFQFGLTKGDNMGQSRDRTHKVLISDSVESGPSVGGEAGSVD